MRRRRDLGFILVGLWAGACAASPRAEAPVEREAPTPTPGPSAIWPRSILSTVPPDERYFQHYGTHPTIDTGAEPRSSFAVDVDTASYRIVRSRLMAGQLPEEAAVRVEELQNAFDYGYEAPTAAPLGLTVEVFPSPYRPGYHVLLLGLKARERAAAARRPVHLTLVLDLSQSMGREGRLDVVKAGLRLLIDQLGARDRLGIVGFASRAQVILPSTAGTERAKLKAAIEGLALSGPSNLWAGLELGYELAHEAPPDVSRRIILCSDGVAERGPRTPQEILKRITRARRAGISLSTLGVGTSHYDDVMLEQLADAANGQYSYLDRPEEARRLFVERLTETLEVAVADAKVQLEFDPSSVSRFRLIGYENRALPSEALFDANIDGGEIGVGGAVTAMYEIQLQPSAHALGELRIAFADPMRGDEIRMARPLLRTQIRSSFEAASPGAQLAVWVAGFAEKLRGSYWARALSYDQLLEGLRTLPESLRVRPSNIELRSLIERARELDRRPDKFEAELPVAQMSFDEVPILR